MKCDECGEMFSLYDLRFIPDGMVPGTSIKKRRALCKTCNMPKPDKNWQDTDTEEYPF